MYIYMRLQSFLYLPYPAGSNWPSAKAPVGDLNSNATQAYN
jgi:hypothetical protein